MDCKVIAVKLDVVYCLAWLYVLVSLPVTGDLKLVEKPQPLVMAPHDFANIKASVKVASTENGIIFGNIGMMTSASLPYINVR